MSFIRSLWQTIAKPSSRYALGTIALVGLAVGAVGVLAFDYSMEATSTDEFCVSCHELEENALAEFIGTSHHTNASGKVAGCKDCHVPKEFGPKMAHVHAKDVMVDQDGLYENGVMSAGMGWQIPRLCGLGDVDWSDFFSGS